MRFGLPFLVITSLLTLNLANAEPLPALAAAFPVDSMIGGTTGRGGDEPIGCGDSATDSDCTASGDLGWRNWRDMYYCGPGHSYPLPNPCSGNGVTGGTTDGTVTARDIANTTVKGWVRWAFDQGVLIYQEQSTFSDDFDKLHVEISGSGYYYVKAYYSEADPGPVTR